MCILFLFVNPNPSGHGYQVILANNRDEQYERPTKPADFWDDDEYCISGLDMFEDRAGGTWIGMSKKGKIGILLNILVEHLQRAKGRGYLVRNYLQSDTDCMQYLDQLAKEDAVYNEFNLVLLERGSHKEWKIGLYSNKDDKGPTALAPGFIAVSNSTLEEPFQKAEQGKKTFESIVSKTSNKDELVRALLDMLTNQSCHLPDPVLERMGQHLPEEICRQRSAIYVKSPLWNYGTRTHTVVIIDHEDNCTYVEKTMKEPINMSQPEWITSTKEFKLLDKETKKTNSSVL